jgi:hypothetical protein
MPAARNGKVAKEKADASEPIKFIELDKKRATPRKI